MTRTFPTSASAVAANRLVEDLQAHFVDRLSELSRDRFAPIEWLRDDGVHGGGVRFVAQETETFDRASVNVSSVHYEDLSEKRLASATALSSIIHPKNPHAPSMHMHISWTELKGQRRENEPCVGQRRQKGTWRVMADLNPSIENPEHTARFLQKLEEVAPAQFTEAKAQGEKYFFIPALERHRGVAHFYLEGYATDDPDDDERLARGVGDAMIETYTELVREGRTETVSNDDDRAQLEYHTLYLFQVLTLDRGTTSGLLVHDQNDVGIMGSLPSHVDPARLVSWRAKVPEVQRGLVDAIVAELPSTSPAHVTEDVRRRLAQAVRAHYRAHPEALKLQASGNVVPPTVQNHNPG